jgi:hypothetical protein
VQSTAPESSGISVWHASPATKDSCPAPGTCMESMRRKPSAVGKQETSLRTMQRCLQGQIGRNVHAYVDDMVVKTK